MPVIGCPGCGSRLNAPGAAAGKAVRCPRCQTVVPVRTAPPAASAPPRPPAADLPEDLPPPRRRRPADDDEPDDRPRRNGKSRSRNSGAPVVLIAGLLAFAVLAGGGFAAYWFGFRDKPEVAGPANPAKNSGDARDATGAANKANPPPPPPSRLTIPPTKTVSVEETGLLKLSLSPDGGIFGLTGRAPKAGGGEPDVVCVYYDLATGKRVGRVVDPDGPGFIAAGGKTAAVTDGSSVFVRDVATGQKTKVADVPQAHRMYAAAPDGKLLVTAEKSKLSFRPWPPADGPVREVDAGSPIQAVSGVFLGGTRVATVHNHNDGGVVRVWDVTTGRRTDEMPHRPGQAASSSTEQMLVAEDGVAMLTGPKQGRAAVWDLSEKKQAGEGRAFTLDEYMRPTVGGRVFYTESLYIEERGGQGRSETQIVIASINRGGAAATRLLYPAVMRSRNDREVAASQDGRRFVAKNDETRQIYVWDLPR